VSVFDVNLINKLQEVLRRTMRLDLDEYSTAILKEFSRVEASTIYRVSRDLNQPFSLAYKKSKKLIANRLLEEAGRTAKGSMYRITVNGLLACIAYDHEMIRYNLGRIGKAWGIYADWREVGAFVYIMAKAMEVLGVNPVNVNLNNIVYPINYIMSVLVRGEPHENICDRIVRLLGVERELTNKAMRLLGYGFMQFLSSLFGLPDADHALIIVRPNLSVLVKVKDGSFTVPIRACNLCGECLCEGSECEKLRGIINGYLGRLNSY